MTSLMFGLFVIMGYNGKRNLLHKEVRLLGKGFRPDLMVAGLEDIDLTALTRQGIRGLILDLDNTLTEWNKDMVKPSTAAWIDNLTRNELRACIVSNNHPKRVATVAAPLRLPAVPRAVKPRRGAFCKAMDLMGTKVENTAVIGDQIFTDVWGGNRLGLFTILVSPLGREEFIGTRFTRCLERLVLRSLGMPRVSRLNE